MAFSLSTRDPHQQADTLYRSLGGRRTPAGYSLHCPAHDDRHPSLSVSVTDQTLLVHCHAACSQEAVLDALRAKGLWGGSRSPIPPPHRSPALPAPPAPSAPVRVPDYPSHAEALYVYVDEHRRSVHRTVRFPGKQFRQHHYRDGHWYAGLGDRILLYNLPALLAADPARPVFLTEGEKDAESLIRKGVLATTVPCGALSWPPECGKWLANRTVIVLGDNDPAGREGAERRAQALLAYAREVKLYTFPELKEGGDVTDWLARRTAQRGKAGEELLATARQAQRKAERQEAAPNPAASQDDGPQPQLLCMAAVVRERIDWLWEPYIARRKLHLLDGDPGVRKSYAMLSLAAQLSRGIPLGSLEGTAPSNPPGTTLLLLGEDGVADTVRPRLDVLGADLDRIIVLTGVLQGGEANPVWLDEAGVTALERAIVAVAPALVVIDPLVAFLGAKIDMNKANQVRAMSRPLAEMAERHRCAVVALRHLSKSVSVHAVYRGQGSIDFSAHARSVLLMGKDPDDAERSILVAVKTNLGVMGRAQAFRLTGEGEEAHPRWEGIVDISAEELLGGEDPDSRSAREEAVEFLSVILNVAPAAATKVIEEARKMGIKDGTLKRAKKALGVQVQRQSFPGGKPGDGYWIWELPRRDQGEQTGQGVQPKAARTS